MPKRIDKYKVACDTLEKVKAKEIELMKRKSKLLANNEELKKKLGKLETNFMKDVLSLKERDQLDLSCIEMKEAEAEELGKENGSLTENENDLTNLYQSLKFKKTTPFSQSCNGQSDFSVRSSQTFDQPLFPTTISHNVQKLSYVPFAPCCESNQPENNMSCHLHAIDNRDQTKMEQSEDTIFEFFKNLLGNEVQKDFPKDNFQSLEQNEEHSEDYFQAPPEPPIPYTEFPSAIDCSPSLNEYTETHLGVVMLEMQPQQEQYNGENGPSTHQHGFNASARTNYSMSDTDIPNPITFSDEMSRHQYPKESPFFNTEWTSANRACQNVQEAKVVLNGDILAKSFTDSLTGQYVQEQHDESVPCNDLPLPFLSTDTAFEPNNHSHSNITRRLAEVLECEPKSPEWGMNSDSVESDFYPWQLQTTAQETHLEQNICEREISLQQQNKNIQFDTANSEEVQEIGNFVLNENSNYELYRELEGIDFWSCFEG